MKVPEEIIHKAVECCSEFLCGECPYNKYEDNVYIMRCVHKLMTDINEYFKFCNK